VAIENMEIGNLAEFDRIRRQLAGHHDPISFLVRTGSVETHLMVQPRNLGLEN
jgi:hypothetical protein